VKHKKRERPGNGVNPEQYVSGVIAQVKDLEPPVPEDLSGVQSANRALVLYPDSLLRTKATPVEAFDEDLRKLVADMAETMYTSKIGVGLSAAQIGDRRRVFIIDIFNKMTDEQKREAIQKKLPQSQLLVAVNPEVWPMPGPTTREIEGCLSLPSIYGHVTRPSRVILKAHSLQGKPYAMAIGGVLGRAVQHEFDHLEGVTILDRFEAVTKRLALKDLSKMKVLARAKNLDAQDPKGVAKEALQVRPGNVERAVEALKQNP
jgi:peptide deformylase